MRKQEPKNPDNWLFQDWDENTRIFVKYTYLGINDTEWPECSDTEKQEYDSKHPEPSPAPEPNGTETE